MKEQTPVASTDPLAVDISWFRSLMDERDRRYAEKLDALAQLQVERDRRYEERFTAQNDALVKAEAALREYKTSANEFRGTLEDQNNKFIPRTESEITTSQNTKRIEQVRDEARVLVDGVKAEIVTLQKLASVGAGKSSISTPIIVGIASLISAILASVISFIILKGS